MNYKVSAYVGLVWLQDLGIYDGFEDAQERLTNCLLQQLEGLEEDDEKESYEETFWFSSKIEEIK